MGGRWSGICKPWTRALLVAIVASAAREAGAHDPFEITSDAHVSGTTLAVHTTLSPSTAARECFTGADAKRRLEPPDFPALRARFEACARDQYRITAGGEALAVLSASVTLGPEGDLEMKALYPRPKRSPLRFEAILLTRLVPRAGVVLTVTGVRTFLGQKLLRPDDPVLDLPITAEAEAPGTPPQPSLGRYLWLGVEHILTGADHLLFLVGILLPCRDIRSVALSITSFTLAHSLTLALAASNLIALSPRIVEPLIAASIVVVGVDDLRRGSRPEQPWVGRWLVTFAFGLVHGLGFATALRQIGLGSYGTSIVGPLVAFNLGVELGQLCVAAPLLAVLWHMPRRGPLAQLPRLASFGVAAAGLIWLVERLTT